MSGARGLPPGRLPSAEGMRITKRTDMGGARRGDGRGRGGRASGGAAERGRGVAAAVAAGAAAAELVHERLGLAEELLGLLAGVGHDGVGALARRARGGLREEVLDHARDLAGPAVEEVGEALAHLPPLVGREEEAEGEAGGSADGDAPQGSPNGAAVLTHGRRGWVKGAA